MTAVPQAIADRQMSAGREAFGDGWQPDRCYGAPGRIEMIGNHVDYNGGPVLAAAIDRRVVIAVRDASANTGINAVFADLSGEDVAGLDPRSLGAWRPPSSSPRPVDFLRGLIAALLERDIPVRRGIELVVAADLPHGVGISSSAALCVALVHALSVELPDPHDVVLIAQDAEHRAGSPCGTMDQSASVFGGLIRYEGADDSVQPVSADLSGHRFVVVNSGVVRTLGGSAYPDRVRETQAALAILRERWRTDLPSLGAIEPRDLDSALAVLEKAGEPVLACRVRHVITEGQRVRESQRAISASDWRTVGQLMTESGRSSAADYDISHPQVERIVELCLAMPGVLGARMMGGGQGGSALVLAQDDSVDLMREMMDREYYAALADPPAVRLIPCTFAVGAGPMDLPQGV